MGNRLPATSGPASLIPFGLGSATPISIAPVARAILQNRAHLGASLAILRRTPCTTCAVIGPHVCSLRLEALGALHGDPPVPFELGHLGSELPQGRLDRPLVRTSTGFTPISWEEALDLAAPTDDARWYPSASGLSDETLFELERVAALRNDVVHLAGRTPGRDVVGWNTVNTDEFGDAELILLWGTSIQEHSPDLLRHLAIAKDRGARVVWFHHTYDARMEAHRFPNTLRSAIFGSRALDAWHAIESLGDLADLLRDPERGAEVYRAAGVHRGELNGIRSDTEQARRVVSIWDAGITDEEVPRIMALHAHHAWSGLGSGVFPVGPGSSIAGAEACGLKTHEPRPSDWAAVIGHDAAPSARIRVHLDTHLRPAMLRPAERVVVLPIQPLPAQRGGAWITSLDGRIHSWGPVDLPLGHARPAWCLPALLASAADPTLTGSIPESISSVREGLQALPTHEHTKHLQAGGWVRIPRT